MNWQWETTILTIHQWKKYRIFLLLKQQGCVGQSDVTITKKRDEIVWVNIILLQI
jgi:hypothetical protein